MVMMMIQRKLGKCPCFPNEQANIYYKYTKKSTRVNQKQKKIGVEEGSEDGNEVVLLGLVVRMVVRMGLRPVLSLVVRMAVRWND